LIASRKNSTNSRITYIEWGTQPFFDGDSVMLAATNITT
jgi:hypothetical protein